MSPTQARFGGWITTLTPNGTAVVEYLKNPPWFVDEIGTAPGIVPLQDACNGIVAFLETASRLAGFVHTTISTGAAPLAHLFGQRVLTIETLINPDLLYKTHQPDVWNVTVTSGQTVFDIRFCNRWYGQYVAGIRED